MRQFHIEPCYTIIKWTIIKQSFEHSELVRKAGWERMETEESSNMHIASCKMTVIKLTMTLVRMRAKQAT